MAVGHTTLYRLYSAGGRCLYIGIAGNPGRRFEQHATHKPWWREVADVRLEHFDSRQSAAVAEIRAIRAETPLYNLTHAPAQVHTHFPRSKKGVVELAIRELLRLGHVRYDRDRGRLLHVTTFVLDTEPT